MNFACLFQKLYFHLDLLGSDYTAVDYIEAVVDCSEVVGGYIGVAMDCVVVAVDYIKAVDCTAVAVDCREVVADYIEVVVDCIGVAEGCSEAVDYIEVVAIDCVSAVEMIYFGFNYCSNCWVEWDLAECLQVGENLLLHTC